MRKSSVVFPLLAFIAGAAGFYLRYVELDTVFDSVTGLPGVNAPITLMLILLSAGIALISVVFAVIASLKHTSRVEYARAFSPSGLMYLAVFFILSAAMMTANVMYFIQLRELGGLAYIDIVFLAFAALTAISLLILARAAYRGRGGIEMHVFSIIPSVFFCLWLVILYRQNASNPVILSYCYQCLALASAALSFYYGAGFAFKKSKPAKTIISYMLTIYFCTIILADDMPLPFKIIFSVIVVAQLINSVQFIKNLQKKS